VKHDDLASRLVRWQSTHGRNHLPWQATRDPYRVWLSEIMLQQTQVATVLGYFERFTQRFPDVAALAAAELDEVLGLWSGLGYYSRARNLHAAARQVVALHGGAFPNTAEQLQTLPGIGRSTAAAIASICFGERVAILDGNVKRVLTRVLGFGADLAEGANERVLWQQAQDLLPTRDLATTMPRYTQAVMDLGAGLCNARKPDCERCPLADLCVARREGRPTHYPVKTRKLKRSAQSLWLLWARTKAGAVWMAPRPTPGVWAGLYCFELFDSREALLASLPGVDASKLQDAPAFKHVLTHKDLYLHPVRVQVPVSARRARVGAGQWVQASEWPALGLPAPVRRLLEQSATKP
jgi:A/G-specific adenine glycosylase